ncbi:uncharacterized protein Z518_05563 [Rhinocladiella mackenziei CBS 650.93]|uniref:Uncharacterized protein n=1 Tax=Rhinocladiella mackenziei CBS 650.93 TaxID=1442369 RepID=A0A0D2H2N4_9EURO|nr:uncharacterized protein Z518_05563 [Rhinocladiella mackenziei CBS 650.93]KIX04693.1 hypothetical protein Z518_05563 [Rhinocladiella mackenziei CBS 650.93]
MQRRPSLVPDLYHVKRTTVTKSPPSIRTEICGTYTSLDSAQAAGLRRLEDEGYTRSSLSEYVENDLCNDEPSSSWLHGPNVLVHARKGDEIHDVEIETTPNSLGVRSKPGDGRVQDNLFYVLRTLQSEGGSINTEIRGIHLSRQAAIAAARHELISGERKEDWYQEYQETAEISLQNDDAEREQIVVLATGSDGEKYTVSVVHES